jgi:thiamine biosynthesis lipoprotein
MDLIVSTPDSYVADGVRATVLEEIERLSRILNTRDPSSEISQLETARAGQVRAISRELKEVLAAYNYWSHRTDGVFSIRPAGINSPRNVDALGKAYIIDSAVKAARRSWPSLNALLLNIGGDIVTWGRPCEIEIANPESPYDNGPTLGVISLHNAAVATSGTYARGAHLTNAQSGISPRTTASATVIAADAVTANALATTMCLTASDVGLQLVGSTQRAEALRMEGGRLQRTSGFVLRERASTVQPKSQDKWPAGYRVTITLPLKSGRSSKRPYVAVWVEDASDKLVRAIAVWGSKSKYYPDLSTAWNFLKVSSNPFRSVTRATRPAGKYELVWDGLNDAHTPVPQGSYRIIIETNQEHGSYAKQTGTINLGAEPVSITLPATTNFDAVSVQYGPTP